MSEESNPESHDETASGVESLAQIERMIAGAAGLCLLGAGAVSVFLTSNQVGTAALLGIGAVLLVLTVLGIPLTGAQAPDWEASMAMRRRKLVEQVKREDPVEGQLKLEVLEQLDPDSRYAPEVVDAYATLYRKELDRALARAVAKVPDAKLTRSINEYGTADVRVEAPGIAIDVEVASSYSDRSLLGTRSLESTYGAAARNYVRRVLITNMRIPNEVADIAAEYDPLYQLVQVVRWRDPQDDMALELALDRLGLLIHIRS